MPVGLNAKLQVAWGLLRGAPVRLRFKQCGRLMLSTGFHISGHQCISIGSLYSGPGLVMEAVTQYGDQRFEPKLNIGTNVRLSRNVHIGCTNSIDIGDNVLIGSNVYITDHDHGVYAGSSEPQSSPESLPYRRPLTADGEVKIESNVFIGEYCCIMKNVTIGEGSLIGAHSVVTRDIPRWTIAVGSPARLVKRFDRAKASWLPIV